MIGHSVPQRVAGLEAQTPAHFTRDHGLAFDRNFGRHGLQRSALHCRNMAYCLTSYNSHSQSLHAFFAIATMSAGQAVSFPQGGEAFPVFEENGRNEAAVRTVVEPNCGLKSI